MKNLILLISCILLFSCSPEKKMQKSVNKYGAKKTVAYLITEYPELFSSRDTVIYDTVPIEVEIKRDSIIYDTIIDFIKLENNEPVEVNIKDSKGYYFATVKLHKNKNGKYSFTFIRPETKEKHRATVPIKYKSTFKIPDIEKVSKEISEKAIESFKKSNEYKSITRNKFWIGYLLGFISFVLLILFIFLFFSYFRKLPV